MPKFSVIVPVYNVEKYIKKCLDSIFNQSFKDFEVIVVNDGTKDKSMNIVKKYNAIIIEQENKGLSEARNTGVKKASGDYLIFVDSDDYIEKDLLKKINESLENNPDIVRYQAKFVTEKETIDYNEKEFTGLTGSDAFREITKYHFFEPAWLYAIKRSYYIKNKFKFAKNTYHEDFGLIPLVIFKSKKVNSINYCGYNYIQRSGSIITNKSYEKTVKKANDTLIHYNYLTNQVKAFEGDKKYFNSFIANSLILKILDLNKKDYKNYKKELKKQKVFDELLDDSLKRKIKKKLIKISPKFYYKVIKRSK